MKSKDAYAAGTNVGTNYKNSDFYKGEPMMTAAEVFNLLNTITWAAESVAIKQSGKDATLDNAKIKWTSVKDIVGLANGVATDIMNRRYRLMKQAEKDSKNLPLYDDECEYTNRIVDLCNKYGEVDL